MKPKFILSLLLLLLTISMAMAQKGYTEQIRKDGLVISTKWSTARDQDGQKQRALLVKLENQDKQAIEYSFDLLFYYEGILRETGHIEESCIDGLKSKVGKLTGTYFIPQKFTAEQLKSPDFNFELDNIAVQKVDNCGEKED